MFNVYLNKVQDILQISIKTGKNCLVTNSWKTRLTVKKSVFWPDKSSATLFEKKQLTKYDIKYLIIIEIFCRSKKNVKICAMYYFWRKKDKQPLKSNGITDIQLTSFYLSNIYSLHFKCTKESKLHWFQRQLLHRVWSTNNYIL